MDAYFAHSSIEKSEFEKMEQYILDRVPAEDFAAIRKNLKPTSIILEESFDKAYHEGAVMEHACPVEIRKSLEPLEDDCRTLSALASRNAERERFNFSTAIRASRWGRQSQSSIRREMLLE